MLDSRYVQANERTLLAWLRTGISLITFGFVIARLGVWLRMAGDGHQALPGAGLIGGLFIILGAASEALGIFRFFVFRRALMEGRPVPTGTSLVLSLALAVALLGGVLGLYVLWALVG